jgi:transcriptional regulator with XRE-family HTH domain
VAKELSSEQRIRLSRALREDVPRRVGSELNQSEIARKLDVKPSTISRLFLDPPMGGSHDLVQRVSLFLNQPKELILDGTLRQPPIPQLRELPNFDRALAEAQQRIAEEFRAIGIDALERAGDARIAPAPSRVTATLLLELATAIPVERTKGRKK